MGETARSCRVCDPEQTRTGDLRSVVHLGHLPLPNALTDNPGTPVNRYPLHVVVCASCLMVQLVDVVPPEEMFTDYVYYSSQSRSFVDDAERLATRLIRDLRPRNVIEVGSNDGYLLRWYNQHGIRCLGIDPAEGPAKAAEKVGVSTRLAYFGPDTVEDLHHAADLIHAHNVMAHIPDTNGFLQAVNYVLTDHGTLVVEIPYVLDLVDKMAFDTIYHEHVYYYSVTALHRLLARHGLTLAEVERIPTHGGSLRCFIRKQNTALHGSVRHMLREEQRLGLDIPGWYQAFGRRVERTLDVIGDTVDRQYSDGHMICGYGAAAKATVMLNLLGVGPAHVQCVFDSTPAKQGQFIPGVGIPIVDPEHLMTMRPDDVWIFAWNWAGEIIRKEHQYGLLGGRWWVPLPTPRQIG